MAQWIITRACLLLDNPGAMVDVLRALRNLLSRLACLAFLSNPKKCTFWITGAKEAFRLEGNMKKDNFTLKSLLWGRNISKLIIRRRKSSLCYWSLPKIIPQWAFIWHPDKGSSSVYHIKEAPYCTTNVTFSLFLISFDVHALDCGGKVLVPKEALTAIVSIIHSYNWKEK